MVLRIGIDGQGGEMDFLLFFTSVNFLEEGSRLSKFKIREHKAL